MDPSYANQYGQYQNWHWWFRGREQVLRALLRAHLPSRHSRKIASLGCGPAGGLAWLMDFASPGGRVVGCDMRPGEERVFGVEVVAGRLEALPFASAAFDVVLLLDVLEHLDDDAGALAEAARVLKPDGVLVATVPAMPSLWGSQDVISHHCRRYSRRGIRDLFRRASLPGARISYFNTFLFPLVATVRWTRALLGHASRLRTDFEDNHPGAINSLLTTVFGLERYFVGCLPMPFGVSLFAVVSPGLTQQQKKAG